MDAARAEVWLTRLREIAGDQHVVTGDALAAFATDIFRQRQLPLALVSPGSVEALQAVVRLAADAGLAVVARGGGASYTDGYLPTTAASLMIDLLRLDSIVALNEEDAYVTVEAGMTWAALAEALAVRGLRTRFRGPFSGSVATIGGTMAQHALSHGTGAFGASADSVLSLDVVLADGTLLSTGSAALRGHAPFLRHCGPDLTGVFLGDCGVMGIKARITLPVLPVRPHFAAASFAFSSFEALHAGMKAAGRLGVDDTHFALDASMIRGQLRRPRGLKANLQIAGRIWRSAPNPLAAIRQLARMALTGERGLTAAAYLAHYIVEGAEPKTVAADLRRLRQAMRGLGQESSNTIPAVVRAQPFDRMFHVLGPRGERWLPMHGHLPHSAVPAFHEALRACLAKHHAFMSDNGVWAGFLYACLGPGSFTVEVGLYWPDATSEYHRATVAPEALAKLPAYPENLALREWIEALRAEIIDLYQAHGAVHFQLGKVYPYAAALQPAALAAVTGLKSVFDPGRRLNPGGLGL